MKQRWEYRYDLRECSYEVKALRGYDFSGERREMTFLRIWDEEEKLVNAFDIAEWNYRIIDDEEEKFIVIGPKEGIEYEKGDPDAYKRWLENDKERDKDAITERKINDPYEAWGGRN